MTLTMELINRIKLDLYEKAIAEASEAAKPRAEYQKYQVVSTMVTAEAYMNMALAKYRG